MSQHFLTQQITTLESVCQAPVLVYATSNIELDHLPRFYETLSSLPKNDTIYVFMHCRGGDVNAARRLLLLLREKYTNVIFIVPFFCESAGTIMALGATKVIAGPLAQFSPIDPHLNGGINEESEAQQALSFQDIKRFREVGQDWFNINTEEAGGEILAVLTNSIFPPSLTAFYRSVEEVRQIASELISFQLNTESETNRSNIVEQLLSGFHSHHYSVSGNDLYQLGLNIEFNDEIEQVAWPLSVAIQNSIGGALRESNDAPWFDALIALNNKCLTRTNRVGGLAPEWRERQEHE